jgi:hypothetical protein
MADPPGQMETMSDATARLRAAGYTEDWIAERGELRAADMCMSTVGVRCSGGAMRPAGSGPLAHLPQQPSSSADR